MNDKDKFTSADTAFVIAASVMGLMMLLIGYVMFQIDDDCYRLFTRSRQAHCAWPFLLIAILSTGAFGVTVLPFMRFVVKERSHAFMTIVVSYLLIVGGFVLIVVFSMF